MEILTKFLPFFRLTLFLIAMPFFGYAQQFPVNNSKIVQGTGTTAQGITSYSSLPPTVNPSATTWRHVTSMHMDTVERVQYIYKRPRWYAVSFLVQSNPPPATESSGSTTVDYTETIWQNTTDSTSYYYEEKQQCWQPVGTVVRDTTPVSTAATGTSAAVCYEYSLWYNSTNDSLYAYTAGDWLAIGSGGGGTTGAVDSISVLQDSIVVGYSEGIEVTRDSIGYPAGISLPLAISDITGLADSLSSHPSGTGTNLRIPVWTGTNSLGSSTLLQSATGQTLDANLAFRITGGTTASRPTGAAGMQYWNTSNTWLDIHNGTSWFNPARAATTNGLFTAGSVLFAGSDGTITQDNANYFWDDTNNRLGIGTTAPAGTMEVNIGTGTGDRNGLILTGSAATGSNRFLIRNTSTNYTGGIYIDNSAAFDAYGAYIVDGSTKSGNFFGNARANAATFIADGSSLSRLMFGTLTADDIIFGTTNLERIRILSGGSVGIGTSSPDRLLHSELSDAVTNAIVFPLRLTHITSGTAAAGSGAGMEFEAESAGGTNRVAGTIENPYTTATNAAEVSDLVFRTMRAGTLTESLRSLGNGTLQIGTLSGTATQLMGATSGNIATAVTLGAGLSFSSGTLNGAFLPLTLTGATEVNTAGQNLYIRDAGAYPYTFMNSNYWLAASSVNNYIDVGSTANRVGIISDGLIELNSSVNTSLITTGRLLIDGDSTVLSGTLPVNTNATHVLVRDAVTERVEEKAISSFSNGIISALPLANVGIETEYNLLFIDPITNQTGYITNNQIGIFDDFGAEVYFYQDGFNVSLDSAYRFNISNGTKFQTDYVSFGDQATGPGAIRFMEDTDNGTNYIGVTVPANLTATETFSYRNTDGTASQTIVTGISPVTATLDFGNTVAGAVSDLTVTVTGAAVGDLVTIGVPHGSVPAAGTYFGWVSAADTVTVRFANNALVTTYDPASGSFKVRVDK